MKITDLKPSAVWAHFAEICAIPHPSHHEEKIRAYVVDFAKKHGIEHTVDEANNVILRKPATPGMEGARGIILQAHLDMVPQKNGDKEFDFEKDPIEAYVDGELVRAKGTTLGADNGIGAAAILAVFEATDIEHGPLEALFTATEETGMEGAFGLKAGELRGEILLNLDLEDEGELCVGCAGGLDANIELPYEAEKAPAGYKCVELCVKGLKGGHSGLEIILQRGNANKLLVRALYAHLDKISLAGIDGGGLRNAIPREAKAVVLVPADYYATFTEAVRQMERTLVSEYKGLEDNISVTIVEAAYPATVIPVEAARRLAELVNVFPNGVVKLHTSIPKLVQTSNNFARVVSDGKVVKMQSLMRSQVRSEKEYVAEQIASACRLAGAKVEFTGGYDGWDLDVNAPIVKLMSDRYEKLYGTKPHIVAVHAGLECGIIGGTYPEMEMISFGPTIRFPHSPDEQVDIASVGKFYDFLVNTLENAPGK